MPALMVAAACKEDSAGDCGEGGVSTLTASLEMVIVVRVWMTGDVEVDGDRDGGSEFRSGAIYNRLIVMPAWP